MGELEWFDAYCKLDNAPGAAEETLELIRKAEADATRKGVVGIRDYEMAENVDTWTRRFSAASPRPRDANDSAWTGIDWDGSFTHGIRGLRVEAGVYPERLEDAIEAGWKTGVELPGSDGLGHVGAMKMISDGSLNTRSAFCSMPYSDIFPDFYGTLSYAPDQIETYFHGATCHRFAIACHAIGDEAKHHRAQRGGEHTRPRFHRARPDAEAGGYSPIREARADRQHPATARHGRSRCHHAVLGESGWNPLRIQGTARCRRQAAHGVGCAGCAARPVDGDIGRCVRHGKLRPRTVPAGAMPGCAHRAGGFHSRRPRPP